MTPEERAARFGQEYWPGYILENFDPMEMESAIAAAIRDAVAEANAQARAALEPFAEMADKAVAPWYRDGYRAKFEHTDDHYLTAGQLRAARDAYLALGGKILDS